MKNLHSIIPVLLVGPIITANLNAQNPPRGQDRSGIVSDNGKNYFVNQHRDGSSTIFTDKGAIYVTPTGNGSGDCGYRVINTGNAPIPAAVIPAIQQP
jgi:hypothetical protein